MSDGSGGGGRGGLTLVAVIAVGVTALATMSNEAHMAGSSTGGNLGLTGSGC